MSAGVKEVTEAIGCHLQDTFVNRVMLGFTVKRKAMSPEGIVTSVNVFTKFSASPFVISEPVNWVAPANTELAPT